MPGHKAPNTPSDDRGKCLLILRYITDKVHIVYTLFSLSHFVINQTRIGDDPGKPS